MLLSDNKVLVDLIVTWLSGDQLSCDHKPGWPLLIKLSISFDGVIDFLPCGTSCVLYANHKHTPDKWPAL